MRYGYCYRDSYCHRHYYSCHHHHDDDYYYYCYNYDYGYYLTTSAGTSTRIGTNTIITTTITPATYRSLATHLRCGLLPLLPMHSPFIARNWKVAPPVIAMVDNAIVAVM